MTRTDGPPRPAMVCAVQGFTLLELVVALALFALVASMAYTGLQGVLQARQRSDEQLDRLAELQTAFLFFGRDVEQAMPRPIRDQYGEQRAAFVGGGSASGLLELTHGGWRNPLQRPRGRLQRVGYSMEDGGLVRLSWNVLDQAQDSEPRKTVLVEKVGEAEVRFLDAKGEWQRQWPPADQQGESAVSLPRALELTLELEDWGRIARLFRVSQWVPPDAGGVAGGKNTRNKKNGNNGSEDGSEEKGANSSTSEERRSRR